MGIYTLHSKPCGCKVKEYIGGKVVVEGCKEHKTEVYYVCPSCSKEFHSKNGKGKGKKLLKECAWSHAQ